MTVPVSWRGLRLPLSHLTLSLMVGRLGRRERDALQAAEDLCAAKVVNPGKTAFVVGPESGFSKSYKWCGANRYIEYMTDADAARLFRGAITEWWQFCRADDPKAMAADPKYPSAKYLMSLVISDRQHQRVMRITPADARTVERLIKQAGRSSVSLTPLYDNTIRIGQEQGLESLYVKEAQNALRSRRV